MSIVWIWLQWRRGKVQLLQRHRCMFLHLTFYNPSILPYMFTEFELGPLHASTALDLRMLTRKTWAIQRTAVETFVRKHTVGQLRAGTCPQVPLISVCDLDCHATCLYEVGQGTIMAGCLQKTRNGARPPPHISPVFWTHCMNSVKIFIQFGSQIPIP